MKIQEIKNKGRYAKRKFKYDMLSSILFALINKN